MFILNNKWQRKYKTGNSREIQVTKVLSNIKTKESRLTLTHCIYIFNNFLNTAPCYFRREGENMAFLVVYEFQYA